MKRKEQKCAIEQRLVDLTVLVPVANINLTAHLVQHFSPSVIPAVLILIILTPL